MKYRIAIAACGMLAAGAVWLAWPWMPRPTLDTSQIVEAPDGHAYQYIAAPDTAWEADRAAAARHSWRGHPGYLATIDDAGEYQFVMDRLFPMPIPM